eukprot:5132575-Ditylum_brightwellii.AAC.1
MKAANEWHDEGIFEILGMSAAGKQRMGKLGQLCFLTRSPFPHRRRARIIACDQGRWGSQGIFTP